MSKTYTVQLEKFRSLISEVENEETASLRKANEAIWITKKVIRQMKQMVLTEGFSSTEEEILFFKKIKPEVLANFIYYTEIFNYELNKQGKSNRKIRKSATKLLKRIDNFLESHQNFHHYYQLNQSHFDDKYFRRLPEEVLITDTNCSYYYYQEENFSTTHDILAAKMLACHKLSAYLKKDLKQIASQETKNIETETSREKRSWTDPKTDLIELIYALQAASSVENGRLETKSLIEDFESVFDIDLKGYRRAYMDIKMRKNPAQFLDHLKACLLKRIDEEHR